MLNNTHPSDASIEASYRTLAGPGTLTPRPAQRQLSALIATSLQGKTPLIAEAPTGTGKSLAYLIGGSAAQMDGRLPLVIATATKALQQQLVDNDLPKLFAAGLLSPADVAIAKGKSNYMCIQNARDVVGSLMQSENDAEVFLSERAAKSAGAEIDAALEALSVGDWNGDFDQYTHALSAGTKQAIAVSTDTCTGKKCEFYQRCAYYKARAAAQGRRILVTNHDLLLMDLLRSSEGSEPALGVADYYLVIDEAHHLPKKAIQIGSTEAPLTQLLLALPKLQGAQRVLKGSPELQRVLLRHGVTEASLDKGPTTAILRELIFELMDLSVDESTNIRRFARGILPEAVPPRMVALTGVLKSLLAALAGVTEAVKEVNELAAPVREKARELQHRVLDVKQLVTATQECLQVFLTGTDCAKWLFRKEDSLVLHSAPLEGADVLNRLLWQSSRVKAVVLLSATLRDVNGFTRFRQKIGAPKDTATTVLPHTFPYEESELVIAGMEHTPKPAERKLFIPELKVKLIASINRHEGTLILFPSWSLLQELTPTLQGALGSNTVKVQGSLSLKQLVDAHRRDIDTGKGSVLAGVATMSEGLDLPGDYCTHVIVVALPFAVPNNPIEQEVAELLGSRYFGERSLPDALCRLIQMVGRLNRKESDRGKVTVFDRRLAATSYGRQMLQSLPPFKTRVDPVTSF